MICFATIVPHPPLLLPEVGKEKIEVAQKIIKALEKINKQLIEIQPDLLLIISPHGTGFDDVFTLNLSEKYLVNFEKFGDLKTKLEFTGDLGVMYQIRESMESCPEEYPLTMVSEKKLDYGAGIPLYYLTKGLENFKIIPLTPAEGLGVEKHFNFGQELKQELIKSSKKIVIIASADLSHQPNGQDNSLSEKFDEKVIKIIEDHSFPEIKNLEAENLKDIQQCGLKTIAILLGLLSETGCKPKILSYENSLEIGFLVAQFLIKN